MTNLYYSRRDGVQIVTSNGEVLRPEDVLDGWCDPLGNGGTPLPKGDVDPAWTRSSVALDDSPVPF